MAICALADIPAMTSAASRMDDRREFMCFMVQPLINAFRSM
jgi:hypothetical protein